ncbi:MAG: hypothetical protein LBU13_01035 [Synergistaceae bacterium]|jgi:hypothetical protein|nr:hypothetical protein [Synergistaceae bacterium]
MEKNSKARKISHLITLPFLVLLAFAFSLLPANAAQVAFTVEKLTVDGKFIVEPTLVTISGNKSAADITTALPHRAA